MLYMQTASAIIHEDLNGCDQVTMITRLCFAKITRQAFLLSRKGQMESQGCDFCETNVYPVLFSNHFQD